MTGLSRRGALSGALGLTLGLVAGPAFAARGVALPTGPMLLTRLIERGLSGGAVLSVERSWEIQFTRQGQGIAITGSQVSAKVDAPDNLASLAQIEESRSTDGMFPLLLSDTGLLVATGRYIQITDIERAAQEARAIIAKRPIPADARAELAKYLGQLQRSGAKLLDEMPKDLFFPETEPLRTFRKVSLPGGLEGEFEVTHQASIASGANWLERSERKVITRIGTSERRSREVWSMAAA